MLKLTNVLKNMMNLFQRMTHDEFKLKKTPYPQSFMEKFIVGRTLPYGRGAGYCFLASLLYGINELSGVGIEDMLTKLKSGGDVSKFFNKKNGFVKSIYEISDFVTGGKYPVNLDLRTESREEAKDFVKRLGRKYFFIAKMELHYVYFDRFGWYINPYQNDVVDEKDIIGWRVISER